MPTFTKRIAAGVDDVYVRISDSTFAPSYVYVLAGSGLLYSYSTGLRFTSITIPQGSTINNAYVTFRAYGSYTGAGCVTRFYCEDVDNATAISSYADYNSRTRTTAYVGWNPGSWTSSSDYNSPDIKTAIQEVIDREGWASGNALTVFWQNNGSTPGAENYRAASAYEHTPAIAALLTIEYTLPPLQTEAIPSTSSLGWVVVANANYSLPVAATGSTSAMAEAQIVQRIDAAAVVSSSNMVSPNMSATVTLSVDGISSARAIAEPTIIPGAVNIVAQAAGSTSALGAAYSVQRISAGAVSSTSTVPENKMALSILIDAISSASGMFAPTLVPGTSYITPNNLASTSTVTEAQLNQYLATSGVSATATIVEPSLFAVVSLISSAIVSVANAPTAGTDSEVTITADEIISTSTSVSPEMYFVIIAMAAGGTSTVVDAASVAGPVSITTLSIASTATIATTGIQILFPKRTYFTAQVASTVCIARVSAQKIATADVVGDKIMFTRISENANFSAPVTGTTNLKANISDSKNLTTAVVGDKAFKAPVSATKQITADSGAIKNIKNK